MPRIHQEIRKDVKGLFLLKLAKEKKSPDTEQRIEDYRELFRVLRPFEEWWGGDIAEQSVMEMRRALSTTTDAERADLAKRGAMLSIYANWYLGDYCGRGRPHIRVGVISPLGYYQTKMVRSPVDLMSRLNLLFEPSSFQTSACVYRTYYWLAFSGVDMHDAGFIRPEHIFPRRQGAMIIFDDDKYPLPPESLVDIQAAATLDEFREFKLYKTGVPMRQRTYQRQPGTELLRLKAVTGSQPRQSDEGVNISGISPIISARRKEAAEALKGVQEVIPKLDIVYETVRQSGFFYRAYVKEQRDIGPDFRTAANCMVRRRALHDDKAHTDEQMRKNQQHMLFTLSANYDMWRIAFHNGL